MSSPQQDETDLGYLSPEDPTLRMEFPAPAYGNAIGPFRLIQPIGQGGMGEVWLAVQKEPVRRRVAIKLIKVGMDTREVVARFESERQALALMDHPAIAKVFDAGSTPDGRPYFAMEYVRGIPVTAYCDKHKLTISQRLELFVRVCEGVQHAHQKAVIHRDLKPSNILVSEVDGSPMPRIIDFGVAKATSQPLTAETMLTRLGAIVGTPGYMSPEQADSAGEDIDTRTDVYSLGVVFYQLLVGAQPLDFHKVPLDQIPRKLREEDAPRPSTKLRSLGDDSKTTAENRRTDPPTLAGQLRGDLDAIALKALDKDRSRRYGSPSDLAADIGRYLKNEPVLAVAPSAAYRARKFARRYRGPLITACAFALVLIAAAGISIWQSVRATKQRDRADAEAAAAQAVNDFLRNDLLAQASAAVQSARRAKPDPDLKVRTALDRAAARITGKFNRQPEVEAAIRDTIGLTYLDLGLYPEARTQLERAVDVESRVLGAENPKTLRTSSNLGYTAYFQGKYAEAETLLGRTLRIQRRTLGSEHPDTMSSLVNLAIVYEEQGKYAQAEVLDSQLLEIHRRVSGPEHRDTLASMNNLGIVYRLQGKYAQAEALLSENLEISRRVAGPEHPNTLSSMHNLASVYFEEGKYAQAETTFSQTLEIRRRVLGPRHSYTIFSMNNLAEVYEAEGKYEQAEALQRQTLEVKRQVLGPEHPNTLGSLSSLANIYAAQGKFPEAQALYVQALDQERRVLGPEHPSTLSTLANFAFLFQRQGKYAMAEAYAAQALEGRRHAIGSGHTETIASTADLALAQISEAKFNSSEPLAREALDFYRTHQPDDWQRFRAESLLGASLSGQKKYAEAEPMLLEGHQGMLARKDRIAVPDQYHLDLARQWLIQLYRAWGKPGKAAEWSKK
jgi:serine/threonine protein kinase/tetratricopeptide (TPR) repeat protein